MNDGGSIKTVCPHYYNTLLYDSLAKRLVVRKLLKAYKLLEVGKVIFVKEEHQSPNFI